MTDPGGKNSPAILNAFLKLYLEDQEQGRVRPLAEYQERFAGYEDQIAERYESLQGSGETSAFKAATLELPAQDEAETLAAPAPGEKADAGDSDAGRQTGSPQQPLKIGPYRLMRPLGEGGMGIVYLAAQTEPIKRQVALKLVRSGMTSEEFLVRFEAERQAIALMNHTNIAKVFDAGTTPDGNPYFAMEYAPGMPLKSYCEREKLGLRQRLDLFLQICSGVRHAHQKGIIHRDLKPSNILVGNDGEKPVVKIIDFGVARSMDQRLTDKPLETEAGQMVGTPEYMSPEQAEMGPAGIDTRTDVYALGVILYELLCGLLPFDSKTLRGGGHTEMKWLICEVDPPEPSRRLAEFAGKGELCKAFGLVPSSLKRRLQGDLDWISMKALDKDRSQRYQSAGELAEDIRRYLVHDPVLAGPPSRLYKLKKFSRKHRVGILSIISLLTISTVIAVLTWQAGIRKTRQQRVEKSAAKLAQAEIHHAEYLALSSKLRNGTIKWKEKKKTHQSWLPVWESSTIELLEDSQELADTHSHLDSEFAEALKAIYGALQEAPEDSAQVALVQENLAALFSSRGQQGLRQSDQRISTDFFSLPANKSERTLSVTIRSEPAGADVYLYRYIEHEFRLLPVPFHPQRDGTTPDEQLHDRAVLEFEAVHNPVLYAAQFEDGAERFAPGDRFLTIDGKETRSRTNLARALEGLGLDAAVEVNILRDGMKRTISWKPFVGEKTDYPDESGSTKHPTRWKVADLLLKELKDIAKAEGLAIKELHNRWKATDYKDLKRIADVASLPIKEVHRRAAGLETGILLNIYHQFGFTFSGSPLPRGLENRLGTTSTGQPVNVELPRGSYLLLLESEDRVPVRVPLVVPGEVVNLEVAIPARVPDGFVYVPVGPFFAGGDDQSHDLNLEPGPRELPGYFMSRLEVSFGEYVEFLNDLDALKRIDDNGTVATQLDRSPLRNKGVVIKQARLRVIPMNGTTPLCYPRDGEWVARLPLNVPVFGVSMLAALEYSHWYTGKRDDGLVYRLPTDLEWEKAARGVDRRIHVWGKHPIGSFYRSRNSICRMYNSKKGWSLYHPGKVGAFPLDESVYGVRDLAGSVMEPTSDLTVAGDKFISFRSGHWRTGDEFMSCVASRNGFLAEYPGPDAGIRLVAIPAEN